MKYSFLILFVCLVCWIPLAYGQRVELSAKEFFDATTSNRPVRFPMRTSRTEELFEAGKIYRTIFIEFEGIPAEASRLTINESERGVSRRSEEIEYGDFLYTRSGSGKWSKEPWYFRHPSSELSTEFSSKFTFWKETSTVDFLKTTVFRKSGIVKPYKGSKVFCDDDFYFNQENELIKRVTTYRTKGDPSALIRRITYTSRYDPNIKIEAPIK